VIAEMKLILIKSVRQHVLQTSMFPGLYHK